MINTENLHFKARFGKKWVLIFYHNVYNESTFSFSGEDEALETNSISKYSIIKRATNFPKISEKYEFIIEYPSLDPPNFNHWEQRLFPTKVNPQKSHLLDFKCINCHYDKNFGGLVKNTDEQQGSLLEGCPSVGQWYFAIGLLRSWQYPVTNEITKMIPGPFYVIVPEVLLWMRVPNNFFCQTSVRFRIFCYPLFIFIFVFLS